MDEDTAERAIVSPRGHNNTRIYMLRETSGRNADIIYS